MPSLFAKSWLQSPTSLFVLDVLSSCVYQPNCAFSGTFFWTSNDCLKAAILRCMSTSVRLCSVVPWQTFFSASSLSVFPMQAVDVAASASASARISWQASKPAQPQNSQKISAPQDPSGNFDDGGVWPIHLSFCYISELLTKYDVVLQAPGFFGQQHPMFGESSCQPLPHSSPIRVLYCRGSLQHRCSGDQSSLRDGTMLRFLLKRLFGLPRI